jgi:hypothetical protein
VIDCGSLEYAHARVQARHGLRAGDRAWQRLETTRDFAALLEVARQSPLRPWTAGITAPAQPHQIEGRLRMHWRAAVEEVTSWMPLPWQASLRWCAALPELPALQHLARGHAASGWMHDDASYRALAAAPTGERQAALAGGPFAPLAPAWPAPEALAQEWYAQWLRRLPRPLASGTASLAQVAAALSDHAGAFAAAAASGAAHGTLLRRALQARLVLLMRRATAEPALAFIHLALTALELERLRGELLSRALFPHFSRAGLA